MKPRAYAASDREACLDLFRLNTPKYFSAHEIGDFERFLDELPGPYFVLVGDTGIAACGGYAESRHEPDACDVCWTIVHPDRQGTGLGRLLVLYILEQAIEQRAPKAFLLNTSQHTVRFFAMMGFSPIRTTEDGYAPGLDRIDMRLDTENPWT